MTIVATRAVRMAKHLPAEVTALLDASDPESAEKGWSVFLRRYNGLLLATARQFGHGHDAAMDRYSFILEELRRNDFGRLRAYAVDHRSRFSTWLVVVARRLCFDYARKRYGRVRNPSPSAVERDAMEARRRLSDLTGEVLEDGTIVSSSAEDVELRVRRREQHTALSEVLNSVSRRDRLLLKLRFDDDRSVRDITRLMSYPSVFHVYRRLARLLAEMRDGLTEKGIEGPLP